VRAPWPVLPRAGQGLTRVRGGGRAGQTGLVNADHELAPLSLGTWPTPVERAPRLAAALGLGAADLWIKRDDLTGLGGGGNKVRKLQYTCAQAVAAGSTALITTGAAQSNHARLTAAAAARLGLACVLVLEGEPPAALPGNLLLDTLAGATVIWAAPGDGAARAELAAERVAAAGGVPFVIPFGGSSPAAARGYVDCARELLAQVPGLRQVVVAVGSGGTMAGLVAGLGADRVIGVHTGAVPDPAATVAGLLAGMPGPAGDGAGLRITTDQVGAGYADVTPATLDAILLAARTEGMFLDPTYTGRALAGLMALRAAGTIAAGQPTVFLHTGGLPGLLARPELAAAPAVTGPGHGPAVTRPGHGPA
jgi:L-cysteate sulfo-lyase